MDNKKKIRSLTGTALFLFFSAGISFWLVPVPPAPNLLEKTEDFPWSLIYPDKEKNLGNAFQTLIRRKPWGEKVSKARTIRWGFRGVIREGKEYIALIESENKVLRCISGDILPGGDVLQCVGSDHIEVYVRDKPQIFRLYH